MMEGGRATPGIGEKHPPRPVVPGPSEFGVPSRGKVSARGSLKITSLTPLVVERGGRRRRGLSIGRAGRVAGRRSAQKANSLVRALGAGAR
ncbi:hypothetical protein EVAR_90434_1 [Eumeta japonica]|uniref:Uncharacterized protein n=1 Tax=Eumeta variegata TaxID=151549 RepID=A0A4C1YCZ0_EUMVA|nr:hypothetical protein EVAR_90434_1 [Eumeta japonica]